MSWECIVFTGRSTKGDNSAAMERRPNPILTVIATATGNIVLVLATVVLGSVASILGWLPPRGHVVYACGRLWSRLILGAGLIPLRPRFEAPLDPARGYIFMANHQGMYDIPAIMASTPGQGRFMAKASLFKIPIFGWALSSGGFIPVDRSDRAAGQRTFHVASESLSQGHSLIIFPEETRSKDGRLLPFKRGGFLLALKTGYPIVPVGIRGTAAIRPRGSHLIRPGPIEIVYGAPIDAASFGLRGRKELIETVRAKIAELAAVGDSG